MNTTVRLTIRYSGLLCIAAVAAATLFLARRFADPAHFDWPAWIQAVGSVAAILAAIWVSADQASQQRQREARSEREKIKGTLRSLAAELDTSLIYITEVISPTLDARQVGEPLRYTFPMPVNPFPVYVAMIPNLVAIPEQELLERIIRSYATAQSLTITIEYHNALLEDLTNAEIELRDFPGAAVATRAKDLRRQVADYSSGLQEALEKAKIEYGNLMPAIASEIAALR